MNYKNTISSYIFIYFYINFSIGKSLNIGKGVAKYFDLKIGDTLVLLGQGYQGMQAVGAYPVSGILDLKNPTLNKITVFMTLSNAQDFLSAKNMITHLILNKQENKDEDAIALNVKNLLNNEAYEVMTWREMIPELEQTIKADSAGGLVMVFILYMIVAFGIFGTVLMMTQERKYEFGVLISIGMKKIRLIKTMIYETILLASVGVFLGIALSRPIIIFLSPIKFPEEQAQMMENMGFEAVIPFMNTFPSKLTISPHQASTKTVAKVWDVWRRGWREVAVFEMLLVKSF